MVKYFVQLIIFRSLQSRYIVLGLDTKELAIALIFASRTNKEPLNKLCHVATFC